MAILDFETLEEDFYFEDEFATNVTFTRAGAIVEAITGNFVSPSLDVELGDAVYETTETYFSCSTNDSNALERGDITHFNGREFKVIDFEQSGTGYTQVLLSSRH
ncbi:hypothetical protein EDC56_1263 [Sinobacterium caligoides]|uniref:ATP-binding sugar transporter Gifsy-2 n=1 Tax=Sinobacterium caligoides TaxID=933926 RepID=A0A3N2E0U5_9GAMM|nr:hypothetical protein [Sinobacterium caligoides]ROS05714.1 hypothetical protein EDC56_1263 [Sinobacterium caligoides]